MRQASHRRFHRCQRIDGNVPLKQFHESKRRDVFLRLPGLHAAEKAKLSEAKVGSKKTGSEKTIDISLHANCNIHSAPWSATQNNQAIVWR
jgi:hypothetical protein